MRQLPGLDLEPRALWPLSPLALVAKLNPKWCSSSQQRVKSASSYFKRYHYCHHHYKVAYATALDIFIIICFISVFCALAEFALLSFLDLYIRCIAAMCRSVSQHDGMCDGWQSFDWKTCRKMKKKLAVERKVADHPHRNPYRNPCHCNPHPNPCDCKQSPWLDFMIYIHMATLITMICC